MMCKMILGERFIPLVSLSNIHTGQARSWHSAFQDERRMSIHTIILKIIAL